MYERTNWKDHVTFPSNLFNIVNNGDGTYTITRAGTVQQEGTPQDEIHFNNIEVGVFDAHTAVAILIEAFRQSVWKEEDLEEWISRYASMEIGTKVLTNSMEFPFNNSVASVSLLKERESVNYKVDAKVVSCSGNLGEIEVTDQLVNGFKLGYTGSAKTATIQYMVTGGLYS